MLLLSAVGRREIDGLPTYCSACACLLHRPLFGKTQFLINVYCRLKQKPDLERVLYSMT